MNELIWTSGWARMTTTGEWRHRLPTPTNSRRFDRRLSHYAPGLATQIKKDRLGQAHTRDYIRDWSEQALQLCDDAGPVQAAFLVCPSLVRYFADVEAPTACVGLYTDNAEQISGSAPPVLAFC